MSDRTTMDQPPNDDLLGLLLVGVLMAVCFLTGILNGIVGGL